MKSHPLLKQPPLATDLQYSQSEFKFDISCSQNSPRTLPANISTVVVVVVVVVEAVPTAKSEIEMRIF